MQIDEISKDEYLNFWTKNKGRVFQDFHWIQLMLNKKQELITYGLFKNNLLLNIFPVVIQKGRWLNYVSLPSFTPFLGGVTKVGEEEIEEFLLKIKCANLFYVLPVESKSKEQSWVTHQIQLHVAEEQLFDNLRQDKKRNVKKAIAQNLVVDFKSDPNLLNQLMDISYRRRKLVFDEHREIEKIIKNYPNHFQVNVSNKEGVLSSLLFVYDAQVAFYIAGGFDDSKSNYNAGPYAMWKGIVKAKEMGLSIFDFEGSKIPNIAQYFKSFGSDEVHYSVLSKEKWYFRMLKKIMP